MHKANRQHNRRTLFYTEIHFVGVESDADFSRTAIQCGRVRSLLCAQKMKLVVANNATVEGALRGRAPRRSFDPDVNTPVSSTDPRKLITRTSSPRQTAIARRIHDRPRSAVWHGHISDMRYGRRAMAKTNAARSKRLIIE